MSISKGKKKKDKDNRNVPPADCLTGDAVEDWVSGPYSKRDVSVTGADKGGVLGESKGDIEGEGDVRSSTHVDSLGQSGDSAAHHPIRRKGLESGSRSRSMDVNMPQNSTSISISSINKDLEKEVLHDTYMNYSLSLPLRHTLSVSSLLF